MASLDKGASPHHNTWLVRESKEAEVTRPLVGVEDYKRFGKITNFCGRLQTFVED